MRTPPTSSGRPSEHEGCSMTQQGPAQDSPTPPGGRKEVLAGIAVGVAAVAAITVGVTTGGSSGPLPTTVALEASAPALAPSGSASLTTPRTHRLIDFSKICSHGSGATVPTGNATEADAYYAAAAQEIGLQQFDTLDAVLSYVGYALTAKRLQDALPAELMDPATLHLPAPGAVLAVRFFAPKITDVSETNTPATTVGWRKLVRLQPAPGSAARSNGIEAAYVLFNFFAPIKAANPFDGADSVNTQVMFTSSTPGMSPIYWFDYGKTSDGALLSKELDAFFDAGHTPDKVGKRAYFVPCGCIACHGGLQLDRTVTPPAPVWDPDKALVNYLDTDHWFDRTKAGDDFASLVAPVIFDQGGFDVLRTLNVEMRDQNQRVQPGSMQHRATAHWVDLHASSAAYVDNLALRALPSSSTPAVQWNGADPTDMAALKRLNHYCFRCHGSVEFDVLDKSMVMSVRSLLLARLQPRGALTDPRATMPPDREIADADRTALRAFLLAH
jgi:hypothetical protein